jgi:hypothetical protein
VDLSEDLAERFPSGDGLSEDIGPLIETLCHGDRTGMSLVYNNVLRMPRDYLEPLQMLLLRTPAIVEGSPEERALIYRDLWVSLEPTFLEWKMAIGLGELSEDRGEFEAAADQVADTEIEYSLPSDMSEAVMANLTDEARDVTRDVTSRIEGVLLNLGGASDRNLLFDVVVQDGSEPCTTAAHGKLVTRLKEVFVLQKKGAVRMCRGLKTGKLDSRRLYRAHTTGTVFKQKEFFPESTEWNILLLLDASGSVRWCWSFIEGLYAALVEALAEGTPHLQVYAYKESEMVCELTKIYKDHCLYTLLPSGATPTGEAVIAAALMMPETGQRLIINVTDGLWNTGVDTWYALEYCRRQQIDLVTLGFGSGEDALELQYGKDFELVRAVEDLPRALEALLRRKLLGGS